MSLCQTGTQKNLLCFESRKVMFFLPVVKGPIFEPKKSCIINGLSISQNRRTKMTFQIRLFGHSLTTGRPDHLLFMMVNLECLEYFYIRIVNPEVRIPPCWDLDSFANIRKGSLRAPTYTVGRLNWISVDEGRKGCSSLLAIKKWKARTVVVRGEMGLLCDPRSELRLEGREKKGKDNKWDEKWLPSAARCPL